MKSVIKELLKRHNNDENQCLAWCIGYIARIERDQNKIRQVLGCPIEDTLIDVLRDSTGETND